VSERGFYGIGIVGSKTPVNVGTLWRTAGNMDASFIFTVGKRYPKQASDTIKAWKHTPLFEVAEFDELPIPRDCDLVGVEQDARAKDLPAFIHPERAVYVLGAEDHGLPDPIRDRCRSLIQIPSLRCLNVAVAGSIVLYDRIAKGASS